jgi:hypothetical protein
MSSVESYAATDAQEWLRAMQKGDTTRRSFQQLESAIGRCEILTHPGLSTYSLYIVLVEIAASAADQASSAQFTPEASERFTNQLICWYCSYKQIAPADQEEPYCLLIYWHAIFIYISVNLNKLECAVGRDTAAMGLTSESKDSELDESIEYTRRWAVSKAAKRAIVHCSLLQKQLGARRLDQEPAIHVPRIVFHAALALYCYAQYGRESLQSTVTVARSVEEDTLNDINLDFPEVKLLGLSPAQIILETNGFRRQPPAPLKAATLCSLYDLLQRFGHWEIARVFARILGLLIHGES